MVEKAPIEAISGIRANSREMDNNPQFTVAPQKFDFNFAEVLNKLFGNEGDTGANALVG